MVSTLHLNNQLYVHPKNRRRTIVVRYGLIVLHVIGVCGVRFSDPWT